MNKHVQWIARTVLVTAKYPDHEAAYRSLTRRLVQEGHVSDWRRDRYHEKRTVKRRRLAFEQCQDIYNKNMEKRVNFLMKSKHDNPWRVD